MCGVEVRGRQEVEPSRLVELRGQCDSLEPKREMSSPMRPLLK